MNNKNGIILCLHFFIGCFLFSTTACQETDTVQEINPTNDYVDAEAIEYDMENRAIEEEYVILLKESEETSPEDVILAGEESRPTPPQSPPLSGSANAKQEDKISLKIKGLLSKHKISSSALLKKNALQGGLLSLRLHPEEAESLSRDKAVEVVEKNRIIALNMAPLVRKPFIPSEADLNAVRGGKKDEDGDIQSYGTERVGGKVNFRNDPSWGHRMVWIVDTGIDKNHPDLHLSHTYSANFTSDGSYGDMVGHGTHVAGIIAAKDNGYGTVGIAAGARLASVKVLNKRGEGSIQNLMAGLSHVYTYGKPGDVVNISIGGSGSSAIKQMIMRLARKGIPVIAAAGNRGRDVGDTCPANVNAYRVYTVGSINWKDKYMGYSNFGSAVDFAAPGHGILSTFKDGKYAYMSGTSMAAPHAAAVIFLGRGYYSTSGRTWAKNRYIDIISQ